jgi:hypothetical protein
MRDKFLIYAGLLAFLLLVTAPFTFNLAGGLTGKAPEVPLPASEKQCVAPADYMRNSHMQLLSSWRDDRVRRNVKTWTSHDGKTYTISLTNTCLKSCHTSKQDFCDRCHSYVGVQGPYCMDCHNDPQQTNRSGT